MSPYIVTTKRQCPACVHGPNAGGEHRPESVSRRAVATLEEAIAKALEITLPYALVTQPADDEALQLQCHALSESGGSVGPFPDGSLSEVARVKWDTIIAGCPPEDWEDLADTDLSSDAEVIAAYNARQAS